MESFLHSVSSVIIILLLTMIGYVCKALGWTTPEAKRFINKYLISIALPATIIYSIRTNLTREELFASGKNLLAVALSIILLIPLSFLAGKWLKLGKKQIGVFIMMCAVSNTMFVGYPICTELFGQSSAPYVIISYFVNLVIIQFVLRTLVQWSGGQSRISLTDRIRSFLKTPPVISVVIGTALLLLDVHLPDAVMSTLRYVNNTVTPLALLQTGCIICEIGLRNLKLTRTLSVMMLFRFILAPALAIATCYLLGISGLPRDVIAIQAAMPVLSMSVVYASEYGADEQLAAHGSAFSTLACFIVIPVLMLIL